MEDVVNSMRPAD